MFIYYQEFLRQYRMLSVLQSVSVSMLSQFLSALTVHPFPRPRRKARLFLRSDPNQLGLESGFAPFQFGRQKRRSRTPKPVYYVATSSGLTFLTGVRERRSSVDVELVTLVVENGHVGLRGGTSRRTAVEGKFYETC